MRAIWEGDITNIEDAAKLQIILENTHTWAMRIFRPLISSYIDTWKYIHLENNTEPSDTYSRRTELINRNRTTLSTVQGFLKDLDPANSDHSERGDTSPLLLGMLFHMISNAERKSLVEELTGIIDAKISRLTVKTETATFEQYTTRQQSQNLHADLSGVFSRLSTVDVDDPRDSDYVDSQPSQSQSRTAHFRHKPDHQRSAQSNTGISKNESHNSSLPVHARASPVASAEHAFSPQTIASQSSLNTGSAVSTKPSSISELQGTPIPNEEVHHSSLNLNAWRSSLTASISPLQDDKKPTRVLHVRTKGMGINSPGHTMRFGTRVFSQADPGKDAALRVSLGPPTLSSIKSRSPSGSVFSPSPSSKSSQPISRTLNLSSFDVNSNVVGNLPGDASSDGMEDLESVTAAYIERQDEDDLWPSGNRIIY